MGFSLDLVDFGGEKMPGLKIALCKRIYTGINNIISVITERTNTVKISAHKKELFALRQQVLDLRFKLRKEEG